MNNRVLSWYYFALPATPPVIRATVRVRGDTEQEARERLRKNSYTGCRVDLYPLLGIETQNVIIHDE